MIVHVLGSMTAGGNERLCLELIRRTPPGVGKALITVGESADGPLTDLFTAIPNLQFFHVPYSRTSRSRFVWELAACLRRLNPRGLIIYTFGLHVLIALAAKAVPSCKCIVHAGNPPPTDGKRSRLFRAIVVASRLLGIPIWFCSEAVHRQFTDLNVHLPRNSRAQPNGIDIETLREHAARGRANRREPGPLLGMVARLDSIKDHDTLLAAFAQVRKRGSAAKLWIVGDGDRRPGLERQIAAQQLEASVSLLGVRRDVAELLGQLDVFVFSTTANEGFGIALAEAMAVGLPIVASDVPACREVLGAECGQLVPPGNADALADAILALLENPARMSELGAAAAQRAQARYDIRSCADRYFSHLLATSPTEDARSSRFADDTSSR